MTVAAWLAYIDTLKAALQVRARPAGPQPPS
jgi:hypothetical protein